MVPAPGHLLILSVCSVSTHPRTPEFKERIPVGVLWTDSALWDSAVGGGIVRIKEETLESWGLWGLMVSNQASV